MIIAVKSKIFQNWICFLCGTKSGETSCIDKKRFLVYINKVNIHKKHPYKNLLHKHRDKTIIINSLIKESTCDVSVQPKQCKIWQFSNYDWIWVYQFPETLINSQSNGSLRHSQLCWIFQIYHRKCTIPGVQIKIFILLAN